MQVDVSLAAADATIIALADPEEVGVVNLPEAEVAGEESEQHTLDSWTVDVTGIPAKTWCLRMGFYACWRGKVGAIRSI